MLVGVVGTLLRLVVVVPVDCLPGLLELLLAPLSPSLLAQVVLAHLLRQAGLILFLVRLLQQGAVEERPAEVLGYWAALAAVWVDLLARADQAFRGKETPVAILLAGIRVLEEVVARELSVFPIPAAQAVMVALALLLTFLALVPLTQAAVEGAFAIPTLRALVVRVVVVRVLAVWTEALLAQALLILAEVGVAARLRTRETMAQVAQAAQALSSFATHKSLLFQQQQQALLQ